MEIILRAAVVFVVLWLITRAVGRSTLGELSSFELLLFITMGDLVEQGITQEDHSMAGGLAAVSTMALLTVIVGWANVRWPKLSRILHGEPVVILSNGRPDTKALRAERMALHDFMTAARGEGFKNFSDIDLAVLEPNGKISFFAKEQEG